MAFKDDLQKSIDALDLAVFEGGLAEMGGLTAGATAQGPEPTNVVNFGQERLARVPEKLSATDITPDQLIPFIANDIKTMGTISKCYVTLVSEEADCFHVTNYRAGLNRTEEIAYRLLGVLEAMENWRADR
jgi:hypothetical protein